MSHKYVEPIRLGILRIVLYILDYLYERVVYFLISSSTATTPCLLGSSTFAVADPKSHNT